MNHRTIGDTPSPVTVTRLQTDKVRYRQGEAGKLAVTLKNAGAETQAVNVEGELEQELARRTPLPGCALTVPAGGEATVELPFTAPAHDYGCAARIRVVQNGKMVSSGEEMFNVAANVWNVAIGADLANDVHVRLFLDRPEKRHRAGAQKLFQLVGEDVLAAG